MLMISKIIILLLLSKPLIFHTTRSSLSASGISAKRVYLHSETWIMEILIQLSRFFVFISQCSCENWTIIFRWEWISNFWLPFHFKARCFSSQRSFACTFIYYWKACVHLIFPWNSHMDEINVYYAHLTYLRFVHIALYSYN